MIIREKIQAVSQLVQEYPEGKILFDTAVEVKPSPHVVSFRCWGCWSDPQHGLWLMDNEQKWHEVREDQANVDMLLNSLLQRLKWLKYNKQKNSTSEVL